MRRSRLLGRGGMAVVIILLLAAVGATAAQRPAKQRESRADYSASTQTYSKGSATQRGAGPDKGAQHGGDDRHLPPVRKNIELVSKLEPQAKGPLDEGQIADVSVHKGFAYLNSWDTPACEGGTFVVDIRDPANPKEGPFLPAVPGSYHGEGAHVVTITTPQFSGDVLAVNNESCTGQSPTTGGGFDLWNVTDPMNPKRFIPAGGADMTFGDFGGEGELTKGAEDDNKANEAHSIFIWDAGDKAYAVIVDNEELHDVDIFDITNPASPQPVREYNLGDDTPAWTETPNQDSAFHHDVIVKKIGDRFVMLNSYWDAGYIQMDVTNPAEAVYMSDTDFGTSDPLTGFDPPEGNAHQAEYSYDNKYILTAEEDFAPYRVTELTVSDDQGTFEASNISGGLPPNSLPDGRLNGPMAYGGYACPDSDGDQSANDDPIDVLPDALTVFPTVGADEERILVVQRGPSNDPNEDYNGNDNLTDDACFPGQKAARAAEAGWDAILVINRHNGTEAADADFCGSGGFGDTELVAVCTSHRAGHVIFGDPAEYTTPYDDETELAPIGTTSSYTMDTTGIFDGWGYMSMYGTTPDENGKLPFLDAFAIPEALNPDYAIGFGDLSIHEQATDPTEPLSYSAYYSGGVRVFSFEGGKITHQGAFIDEGGNDIWGIEQFTTSNGERLMAASDRDSGLYILRYTGPLAAKRPGCTDSAVMVPYKGTVTVPLPCSDVNVQNVLTRSIVSGPSQGTLASINQAAGTVTYTHTGTRLGADSFTFKANDGAADSPAATARIQIVPTRGGRCLNPFTGTDADEVIDGSPFGDRINSAGGRDNVKARDGDDCVNGGSGDDQLLGGLNNDDVTGGSGNDRLFGESGRDALRGGSGNDHLRGSSGNDVVSGGAGRDRVDGGSNDDRVSGGGGNDRLYAGPGRDRLFGGSGQDRLEGGAAVDVFSAGSGNDRVLADDGQRERIRCGRGRDRVRADGEDRVARDCEVVTRVRRPR